MIDPNESQQYRPDIDSQANSTTLVNLVFRDNDQMRSLLIAHISQHGEFKDVSSYFTMILKRADALAEVGNLLFRIAFKSQLLDKLQDDILSELAVRVIFWVSRNCEQCPTDLDIALAHMSTEFGSEQGEVQEALVRATEAGWLITSSDRVSIDHQVSQYLEKFKTNYLSEGEYY